MPQLETQSDWRDTVNPIFPLAIQLIQMFPRLIRSEDQLEAKRALIEGCEKAISRLPQWPADMTDIDMSDWQEKMGNDSESAWLADPEVSDAMARLLGRLKGFPKDVFTKHFGRPHWWMTESSWVEFLQEQAWVGSVLNIVSLLHLNVSLPELTQRVSDGDFALNTRLFRRGRNAGEDAKSSTLLETVLRPLKDRATRIVARQLLLRPDPPGYLLRLRMALYFGWDFGLSDLSIPELHRFLVQLDLIPNSYDPETLRKYRDRIRGLIDKNRKPCPRSLKQ